ncbi:VirB4 family type IV secretion system protein [Flavonifractor plautii]|uniref:VirB4 family type IV secretion system protein n=1 Tax=Flavonifractor plautii TaxID=292800 RepID=UPI0032C1648D
MSKGVVVTRDKRFVKILELLPVNFYTMSSMDKSAAIEDFAAYLKIAPANLQINVLTQPFDLDGYLKLLRGYLERETNEQCRLMLEESMDYVPQLVEREALTHRFFLSFSYDPSMKAPDHTPEAIAAVLNEKAEVARRYLDRCGVAVLEPEYADNFILELFYKLINKHTSQHLRLPDGVFDMLGMVHGVYDEEALKALDTAAAESAGKKKRKWFSRKEASPLSRLEAGATTIPDLIAPPDIDTHHPDYLLIDGVCHAYLYISGYGYSTVVGKGWLTPLIEAGEGVSLSFYLVKQPREKTVNAIGQTTMINRSRMRDVGDTRQDFEELGDAIGAGLYLKEGMNREGQDFYYMHTLIEVIADDPDTLEQRVTAVETLCVASDMLAKRCEYKHEAAFLSFLPLLISDPDIERKSRRNALTSGVAASFPFASFELSDQKGIFLGLNLYNRSPVFIDLYDDYKYTNGNFAAFGNSGAGKSTLLQSIGKRLREQQRKVIYIVPEKGHEYRPLCEAVGGQFIKLGPSSPDCIGLMDIRRLKASPYAAQNGGTQRRESLLAEKVSWLSVWYSLQKRNLSEEGMNYIDASLIECYGRRGITFDNASLFEEDGVTIKEMPVIQEWYDILREKQETKHLSVILTRYVSGSAASMGGHTNVDTENPYIVIDLTDIPDDLQLATVYAATGFATDITVQNGDVGTALLSDELWKLLGANSNPLAADYTMRMVKLIRSQGGVAGVTSQGMADMMALDGGKYGKGILDSCRIKFIMQMEDQEARLVQNILNLTEEETKMITRFRRGEGLLCIGHNHVPIAVHVSPREYEAITTSPTDLRARQQARVE